MSTTLIHHPYKPPAGFAAHPVPLYKASTIFFESVAQMRSHDWREKDGYSYGLHGTPTSFTLEQRLCTLEGAGDNAHCILTPSGLASIALVDMALLQSGDEVLIPSNSYSPNITLAQTELTKWGVTHQVYDPMNLADLAAKISDKTKLVWIEPAGSVTLEFPDVIETLRLCKSRGVTTALDNTWGAGLAFNAFDVDGLGLGADITVHALTKYPSGAANLLMGSVITNNKALYECLKLTHMHIGTGVGADDVASVLQSLPTVALRYDAQDASTRALAAWMQTQPQVARVLHPALTDPALTESVGYAHWQQLTCTATRPHGRAAAIFSVIFKPKFTLPHIDAFCESLKLFKLGYSWAGPVSLVVPYKMANIRDASVSQIAAQYAGHSLVRFCIGLEDVQDLRADLGHALERLI